MNLKRSPKIIPYQAIGSARQVKQASVTPKKTVVAITKHGVKLEVTNKLPNLAKDTVLFVETNRPAGLSVSTKRQRLKELNETWRNSIKA